MHYDYALEKTYKRMLFYENYLAKLELIRYINNPKTFYKEAAYYKRVDKKKTFYSKLCKIQYKNFNRGTGYLTHGFDMYRGSFHGQMIRALINYCNLNKDDIILDPFCGSGTTLIEASLLGLKSIGIDINPIACLSSKVKVESLRKAAKIISIKNEKYFKINYYKRNFPFIKDFNRILERNIIDLFYFFNYTRALVMSERFSVEIIKALRKISIRNLNLIRRFKKINNILKINLGNSKIFFGNTLDLTKKLPKNSIGAIITSPPYLDLIDFMEEDKIQLKNLFENSYISKLKNRSIEGMETNFFWKEIEEIVLEFNRILKSKSLLILDVGNYKNMEIHFKNICLKSGFILERIIERSIFNKNKIQKNIGFLLFFRKP